MPKSCSNRYAVWAITHNGAMLASKIEQRLGKSVCHIPLRMKGRHDRCVGFEDFKAKGLSSYSLPNMEKDHIKNTLTQVGWNRTRAANILGISLPTLRSKIKKYGITPYVN